MKVKETVHKVVTIRMFCVRRFLLRRWKERRNVISLHGCHKPDYNQINQS